MKIRCLYASMSPLQAVERGRSVFSVTFTNLLQNMKPLLLQNSVFICSLSSHKDCFSTLCRVQFCQFMLDRIQKNVGDGSETKGAMYLSNLYMYVPLQCWPLSFYSQRNPIVLLLTVYKYIVVHPSMMYPQPECAETHRLRSHQFICQFLRL